MSSEVDFARHLAQEDGSGLTRPLTSHGFSREYARHLVEAAGIPAEDLLVCLQ